MHYDPMEKHLELMRHAPRAMKYDGSVPFEQWQEAARQKLAELNISTVTSVIGAPVVIFMLIRRHR